MELTSSYEAKPALWTRTRCLVDADMLACSDMSRRPWHVTEIDSPLSTAVVGSEPQSVLARPSSTPQCQASGTVYPNGYLPIGH